MTIIIQNLINKVCTKLIKPTSCIKLDNPKLFTYLNDRNSVYVSNLSISKAYRASIIKVGSDQDHFYNALISAKNLDDTNTIDFKRQITSYLSNYYNKVQPKNALEWMRLSKEEAPLLEDILPWEAPMPWSAINIEEMRSAWSKWTIIDNFQGNNKKIDITNGHADYGPVSLSKLKIESNRLSKLYRSIKNRGYIRSNAYDGDIGAIVLVNKAGELRWIATPGQHRLAVLTALNYKTITVRIKRIIYEQDYKIWPNVLNGIYTEKGALKLFKSYF